MNNEWRVRWADDAKNWYESRTLAGAVRTACGMDARFRKGKKSADGSYFDPRTGIVIERIKNNHGDPTSLRLHLNTETKR